MTWNKKDSSDPQLNKWGGQWTEKKLDAFSKYVWSYLKIMQKRTYWKTIYFDGFAGSGSRVKEEQNSDLFQQLKITEEEENTYRGAAERVLTVKDDLKFNYCYFIDKDPDSLSFLKERLDKLVDKNHTKLAFRTGDSNHWINELAEAMRKNKNLAALIFLDPFGMQISWESIEKLKGTRSDVWILVPTGVIVNRLLDRKGELKHIEKLKDFFGLSEEEIRQHFYIKDVVSSLFGEAEIISKVKKPIEKIAELYINKMSTIWNHVSETPLKLLNKRGVPIFHFVFASNDATALKIAKQIISKEN